MSRTYKVTLPVSITLKEGVNYHKPVCGFDLDDMDEEQLYLAAERTVHNTLLKGTSPYLKEFIVSPQFSEKLVREGKIRIEVRA